MRFSIGLTGPDAAEEIRDLRGWLDDDAVLRAQVSISNATDNGEPEAMGSGLELLEFVVDTGINLGSLIVSIAAWRASRRSQPALEFRLDDGGMLVMSASDDTTVKQIVVMLSDAISTDDSKS